MTDEEAVLKAEHAQRLLGDPLLKGAFDELRAVYLEAWEGSPARDSDMRERLWQAIQILGKVKSHLESFVTDGTVSKATIDRMARGAAN